jgi:hypothetical protein
MAVNLNGQGSEGGGFDCSGVPVAPSFAWKDSGIMLRRIMKRILQNLIFTREC